MIDVKWGGRMRASTQSHNMHYYHFINIYQNFFKIHIFQIILLLYFFLSRIIIFGDMIVIFEVLWYSKGRSQYDAWMIFFRDVSHVCLNKVNSRRIEGQHSWLLLHLLQYATTIEISIQIRLTNISSILAPLAPQLLSDTMCF